MGKGFENKRILVTGATGLIGSNLTQRLIEEGASVIVMGRNEKKLVQVFRDQLEKNKISYVVGDISKAFPDDINDIDFIFHAASPISGNEIKEKPVETIYTNLKGAMNCLEFLKYQNKGRMIVFSSATVYGNQLEQEMVVNEEETSTADALHTLNTPYSESKRMTEVLVRAYYSQYGVDSVIVRIAYVYGYTIPAPKTAFYEFIYNAVNNENIILNNSGMGRRDNIYINDVVEGLLVVAEKGKTGESYNLSSNGEKGNYKAIDEIAIIIADCVNSIKKDCTMQVLLPDFDGERKPGMRMNNLKVKELGWMPVTDIQEGIYNTVRKYLKETNI